MSRGRSDGPASTARFGIGEVIHHRKFGYRGVIVDVDPSFGGTEEWYEQVARSRPPKEKPWYHVLPDGADHWTYVAERHLEPDAEGGPIRHPDLHDIFSGQSADGRYVRRGQGH